ncbi:hypothetical protein [Mesorhizobium sp. M0159]|uniref:hypothetical protein n=1 Tax=Mesorhizobium sp. M0159 TaxID=2956900 RepID=UPI003336B98B
MPSPSLIRHYRSKKWRITEAPAISPLSIRERTGSISTAEIISVLKGEIIGLHIEQAFSTEVAEEITANFGGRADSRSVWRPRAYPYSAAYLNAVPCRDFQFKAGDIALIEGGFIHVANQSGKRRVLLNSFFRLRGRILFSGGPEVEVVATYRFRRQLSVNNLRNGEVF